MMMIGIFAVTGTLALAMDENKLGTASSVALFVATSVAWAFLLLW